MSIPFGETPIYIYINFFKTDDGSVEVNFRKKLSNNTLKTPPKEGFLFLVIFA